MANSQDAINGSRRIVVTVHGAASNRAWQASVQKVLDPHFRCLPYSFDNYSTLLGIVAVVLNVPLVVAAISAFVVACIMPLSLLSLCLFLSVPALLLLSIYAARRKRAKAAEKLRSFIAKNCPLLPPHVIAHSFGTYLVGTILQRFYDVRLANVVLVSAVLPTAFPWRDIVTGKPQALGNLRSEFGGRDYLTKIAARLGWLAPDIGGAGANGFDFDATHVHSLRSPVLHCGVCTPLAAAAKIHNVSLEAFGHSDQFLGDQHSRVLWLPFLWDISIDDFTLYLRECFEAAQLERDGLFPEASDRIEALWQIRFAWLEQKSFEQYAEIVIREVLNKKHIPPHTVNLSGILEDVKMFVHKVVELAAIECAKTDGAVDAQVARRLHPRFAIASAAMRIVG
jgi:pimeloyl-ACP methyl ester carboxylesterase